MIRARTQYLLIAILFVAYVVVVSLLDKRKLYETCEAARGASCEEGLVCVPVNGGVCTASDRAERSRCPGSCMRPCGEGSPCPGGATCRVNRDGTLRYCAPGRDAFP